MSVSVFSRGLDEHDVEWRNFGFAFVAILFVLSLSACNTSAARLNAAVPTEVHSATLRGSGDLALIVERATGSVLIVDTTQKSVIQRIEGLGDLSHAHAVYSRDARFAFVFGRDGGLTRIDMLTQKITHRVIQAGNAIGGSISQDGHIIATQNYDPGGIKLFSANDLTVLADIPAEYGPDKKRSKVVGLADLPGNRFVAALYDADEIWVLDAKDPSTPKVEKFSNIGRQPYDGLATKNGRYFLAGLFGEDGIALLDSWQTPMSTRKILPNYGRGEEKLPVYKMPHLRGWSVANDDILLPAIGRHEVLMADARSFEESGRIKVQGQPVFVMVQPGGKRAWVNFAFPDNDTVEVIEIPCRSIVAKLNPGKAILHMEFTARGEEVWVSARDSHEVVVYDTQTLQVKARLNAQSPSGIFMSWRAHQMGM